MSNVRLIKWFILAVHFAIFCSFFETIYLIISYLQIGVQSELVVA